MTNETKQTAVEWYINISETLYKQLVNKWITLEVYIECKAKLKEEAKEKEKEQIMNAYTQGQYDGDNIREGDAYEYYNQTYEGNK